MTDAEIKKALEQLAPRRPIIVSDALRGALLGVEFDTLQAGAGLLPCPTWRRKRSSGAGVRQAASRLHLERQAL
jgi:hypothetical protein